MGKITEAQLKTELRSGQLSRVYFLYGEEEFLTKTYVEKIIGAAVPEDARDMNFVKYSKAPKSDELSDQLENMPFFSEYKCVLIEDLDADGMDNAEHKAYLSIIENLPETSVLIIAQEHIELEQKKLKAKMKKLLAACESAGVSCEFKPLTNYKLSEMASKKFARSGLSISKENAAFLAEECGGSLSLLQTEIEKLCAYKTSGEITREDIEKLVPRQINSNIYNLAKELFAGRTGSALHILDDLFSQKTEPFMIFAALSGHFTDLYRAKLGVSAKKNPHDAAKEFGYPPNRAFLMEGAYRSANNLSKRYLGDCMEILYRTNKLLNSSKADKRILLERAITEIAALPKK